MSVVSVTEIVSPTAVELVSAETKYAALAESIAAQVAEKTAIERQMQTIRETMQAQLDVLATRRRVIETEIYDVRLEMRRVAAEIERLKRLLVQEASNRMAADAFKQDAMLFESRMASASYLPSILKHQSDGAMVLASNRRSILGDKRGLGKTLTVLAALDCVQAKRVIVFVPDDVLSNFVDEIAMWSPHRSAMAVGKMPKAQREFALNMASKLDEFIIVCNYSAWRKDKSLLRSLVALHADAVVCDEAHELKNVSTSKYLGVRQIVLAENNCPKCDAYLSVSDLCGECGWNANERDFEWSRLDRCSVKYVYPMTGTVILNKPQDLYAQLSLINPDNFSSERTFLNMYCTQNYYTGKWEFAAGGLERLTKRLSGAYLARDETMAGVVRPKQSIFIHSIEMDAELYPLQAKVCAQLTQHAQILLGSGAKMNVLATIALITRKRQANVWPAGIVMKDDKGDVVFSVGDEVQESVKLDKIIRRVKENEYDGLIPEFTEEGSKALGARVAVFSQFKGPLAELERRCNEAGVSVVRFDGDTPDHIALEAKRDFDRRYSDSEGYEYKWQVILCNYRKGGVGLNFTAVTETILLDEEWSPGKADQAMGRSDRMGQTEETNVHILRIPNSIDSWMVALNDQKQDMIDGFSSSVDGIADQLLDAIRKGEIL